MTTETCHSTSACTHLSYSSPPTQHTHTQPLFIEHQSVLGCPLPRLTACCSTFWHGYSACRRQYTWILVKCSYMCKILPSSLLQRIQLCTPEQSGALAVLLLDLKRRQSYCAKRIQQRLCKPLHFRFHGLLQLWSVSLFGLWISLFRPLVPKFSPGFREGIVSSSIWSMRGWVMH